MNIVVMRAGAVGGRLAQDLAAHELLELEALRGGAARMGRELGVATSVQDLDCAALALHADGAR